MIMKENMTIKEAAKKLNMKYSAAKSIVKIFKDTGRSLKLSKRRPFSQMVESPAKKASVDLGFVP